MIFVLICWSDSNFFYKDYHYVLEFNIYHKPIFIKLSFNQSFIYCVRLNNLIKTQFNYVRNLYIYFIKCLENYLIIAKHL